MNTEIFQGTSLEELEGMIANIKSKIVFRSGLKLQLIILILKIIWTLFGPKVAQDVIQRNGLHEYEKVRTTFKKAD
jgi:hypothetical protein